MHTTQAESGSRTLAILGYHKIGEPPAGGWSTWSYVPEAVFEDTLRYLRDTQWNVIDHAAFLRGIANPESLPAKAALITFDDGYRSNLEVAVPWLQRFGFPAVMFVPTAYVGGRNAFDADIFFEPEEPICSWAELRELERHGVSVQSHGVTHQHLSELDLDAQEEEMRQSKLTLEAQLSKPIETFSYPYGNDGGTPSVMAKLLRRVGYQAACLYGGGINVAPFAEPYQLARLAMGPDTDFAAVVGDVTAGTDGVHQRT